MIGTRAELKNVRKELRADTQALEFWIKDLNTMAMPVIVAVVGVLFLLWRRGARRVEPTPILKNAG